MAEQTAKERRATAREQRRAAAADHDEPTVTDAAEEAATDDPAEALRAAASAVIAAAAVGAAHALARRRQHEADSRQPEDDVPPTEAEQDDEGDEDDEPELDEPELDEPREERHAAEDPEPQPRAVAPGDARRIVERARDQLRDFRGADAESVSSVRPTAAGWRVALEVVEVRRIPESTDLLGTYEVELDEDGDLVAFERTARYHRSEADRR